MPENVILICAGQDAAAARKSGCPLLHLGLGLESQGGLTRHTLSVQSPDGYLGISDFGLEATVAQGVLLQIVQQARQIYAKGIFADFERNTPAIRDCITRLDTLCNTERMPLYVPVAQATYAPHAQVLFDTAISGGSLRQYIADLRQQYGNRLVASLSTVMRQFPLPAPDSEGEAITNEQLQALLENQDIMPFFSSELCAKYFTYQTQAGTFFVVFDDANTVTAKLRLLEQVGIDTVFALYADVAHVGVAHD